MHSHTFWRHQGSIFGLDKYHCYIFGGFTYYLKTHSTYPSVNYHCYSIDSHTSWQRGWHICISELPLIFDGFTYFLKTQEWHMCIRELPLSFSGFTYHLKTQGSIFVLVDHHCHLMDLNTCSRCYKGIIFLLVNYHCYIYDEFTYQLKFL